MKGRRVVVISGFVIGSAACGGVTSSAKDKPYDGNGSSYIAPRSPEGGASLTAAGAPGSPDSGLEASTAGTGQNDAGIGQNDAGIAETDAGIGQTDAGTSAVDLGLRRGATLADLDTACGSVTGRDVLALLQASYGSTFVYESNRSLTSTLTIQIEYDHGVISCAPNFCPCDPPPPPAQCQPCSLPPTLYIDLATTFETTDGSFDEQFVGTAQYLPGNDNPINIYGMVPAASFRGAFPKRFGATETFSFGITLRGSTTSGQVSEITATQSAGDGNWGF